VLEEGDPKGGRDLTLKQLAKLVDKKIKRAFLGQAVTPQIHVPDQGVGDLLDSPYFPNPAFLPPPSLDCPPRIETDAAHAGRSERRLIGGLPFAIVNFGLRHAIAISIGSFICVAVVVVVGLSVNVVKRERADGLTPSSQFMSSVNALINGPQMVAAAAESRATSDGGKVQDVSRVLNNAAAVLDKEFAPLADCFRRAECGEGSRFSEMCARLSKLTDAISKINTAARNIPGVILNAGEAAPLYGAIDIHFDVVSANNVSYLVEHVCH
jgi:hypothetical protein